jgi:hypothetical protein
MRTSSEMFYARSGRSSFDTAKTQIGHLDIYQPVGGLPVKTAN